MNHTEQNQSGPAGRREFKWREVLENEVIEAAQDTPKPIPSATGQKLASHRRCKKAMDDGRISKAAKEY
jgi:hypothetical protein